MSRSSRRGISLLSTVISIVIIAILAALLVSVSSGLAARGKSASCANNLRQIGVALLVYLSEHNGQYPPNRGNPDYKTEQNPAGVHHQDALKHYLTPYPDTGIITAERAGPFWCPADKARHHNLAQHSYGANYYIGGAEAPERRNIRQEPEPSKRLYLIDATRSNYSTSLFSHNTWPFVSNGSSTKPNTEIYVDFRHNGKANGLFLDGHVATFNVEQLRGEDPRKPIASP